MESIFPNDDDDEGRQPPLAHCSRPSRAVIVIALNADFPLWGFTFGANHVDIEY